MVLHSLNAITCNAINCLIEPTIYCYQPFNVICYQQFNVNNRLMLSTFSQIRLTLIYERINETLLSSYNLVTFISFNVIFKIQSDWLVASIQTYIFAKEGLLLWDPFLSPISLGLIDFLA